MAQAPIFLSESTTLAREIVELETAALRKRSELQAMAANLTAAEKGFLSVEALDVLRSPPINTRDIAANSAEWSRLQNLKRDYQSWRKALEKDPEAILIRAELE